MLRHVGGVPAKTYLADVVGSDDKQVSICAETKQGACSGRANTRRGDDRAAHKGIPGAQHEEIGVYREESSGGAVVPSISWLQFGAVNV